MRLQKLLKADPAFIKAVHVRNRDADGWPLVPGTLRAAWSSKEPALVVSGEDWPLQWIPPFVRKVPFGGLLIVAAVFSCIKAPFVVAVLVATRENLLIALTFVLVIAGVTWLMITIDAEERYRFLYTDSVGGKYYAGETTGSEPRLFGRVEGERLLVRDKPEEPCVSTALPEDNPEPVE